MFFLFREARPNRPFFENLDIPGGQFDERTSLAELKRKFEFLEHTSKPSHVSDDLAAGGPVAWYEPEEDELFYDNGGKYRVMKKITYKCPHLTPTTTTNVTSH